MQKVLYAIKTTSKYQSRINSVLETWLSGLDDYIFYSDHEDTSKNIILSSHDSSYEGLVEKSLYFYNNLGNIFINENDESILDYYDWVLVCDDDTFVNTKKVKEFVKDCDPTKAYCEIISPQKNPDNPIWSEYSDILNQTDLYYSGGAGILLPTNCIKKINKFLDYKIRFEDCTIGITLHRNGIILVDCPLFHSQQPEFWGHSDKDIIDNMTYHHIDENRMYKLQGYLND